MFNFRKIVGTRTTKSGKEIPIYEPIGEKFTKPSLTIPDQSLPLKTLLTRYRRDGTEFLEGVYTGDDPDLPDNFERMDKMERIEFARQNAERIAKGRSQLDKRTADQKAAAIKAAFDDAVAKQVEASRKAAADPDVS